MHIDTRSVVIVAKIDNVGRIKKIAYNLHASQGDKHEIHTTYLRT